MVYIYFIQPMTGRNSEDIEQDTTNLCDVFAQKLGIPVQEVEVVNPYVRPDDFCRGPIWYLGTALQQLDKANVIVFADGWEKSKGCQAERQVLYQYEGQYDFLLFRYNPNSRQLFGCSLP